jgi:hypothetical protein
MSERLSILMWNPQQGYQAIAQAWSECAKPMLMAGHKLILEIKPEKRSDPQNRRMWAMLTDVSKQVDWYGQKMTPEDWKTMFTAALKRERVVPGINGGFVVLGQSTSKMTKAEMCELQELIEAFSAERGVMLGVDMETGEIQ